MGAVQLPGPKRLYFWLIKIISAQRIMPSYFEQLGHATIELPVSTYGRWLKKKAPGALDRLDCAVSLEGGSRIGFGGRNGGNLFTGNPLLFKHLKWSRRSGLNGTTCHRFGPETCLTDSYKGGQPPCTNPTKGAHPLRAPQVVRSTNRDAQANVSWSVSCVTYGAGDPD